MVPSSRYFSVTSNNYGKRKNYRMLPVITQMRLFLARSPKGNENCQSVLVLYRTAINDHGFPTLSLSLAKDIDCQSHSLCQVATDIPWISIALLTESRHLVWKAL